MLWLPVQGERAGTLSADAPGPLAQFVLCNATYIILIYFLVSLLSLWPLLLKTHHNLILHSLSKTVLRACLATASAKFVNTHIEAASSSILNVLMRHFLNTICSCWQNVISLTLYPFYVNVKATFGSNHFYIKMFIWQYLNISHTYLYKKQNSQFFTVSYSLFSFDPLLLGLAMPPTLASLNCDIACLSSLMSNVLQG